MQNMPAAGVNPSITLEELHHPCTMAALRLKIDATHIEAMMAQLIEALERNPSEREAYQLLLLMMWRFLENSDRILESALITESRIEELYAQAQTHSQLQPKKPETFRARIRRILGF